MTGLQDVDLYGPEFGLIVAKVYASLGVKDKLEEVTSKVHLSQVDAKLVEAIFLQSEQKLGNLDTFQYLK